MDVVECDHEQGIVGDGRSEPWDRGISSGGSSIELGDDLHNRREECGGEQRGGSEHGVNRIRIGDGGRIGSWDLGIQQSAVSEQEQDGGDGMAFGQQSGSQDVAGSGLQRPFVNVCWQACRNSIGRVHI